MIQQLNEDKRVQLLSQSKSGEKERDGKTRYQKRVKSRVRSNVSQLNRINFNQLFKYNIITLELEVDGETDTYTVSISFGGFLDELHKQLKQTNNILSLRPIIRALLNSFNNDNVYIRCSCPDFRYRHAFWASKNNIIVGDKENRPSDITNPNNTLGAGCKHILLVLSNTSWVIKLASVIFNYINYMEKHYKKLYSDVIYPVIYQKKYEEPVQLDIDSLDKDELEASSETVDKSNTYARDKNKFKKGNPYRFQPKNKPDKNQLNMSIFNDENEEEE